MFSLFDGDTSDLFALRPQVSQAAYRISGEFTLSDASLTLLSALLSFFLVIHFSFPMLGWISLPVTINEMLCWSTYRHDFLVMHWDNTIRIDKLDDSNSLQRNTACQRRLSLTIRLQFRTHNARLPHNNVNLVSILLLRILLLDYNSSVVA